MSTNPYPDYNQPQYMTLSPDWSALLKIGRAYRLLFQFNLIWILLTVGFVVAITALVVMNFADLENAFHDAQTLVVEEMKVELESSLDPEAAVEMQSTELVNPSEESELHLPLDFDEIKFMQSLGETPLMLLCLFFLVFMFMALIFFLIQIIVLVRFANCPNSIVPGGHGVGVAYAICMGLSLILTVIIAVTAGENDNSLIGRLAGPLNFASFILFLVFSHKIAVAVQSQSGRRWLTILIVSICGLFFSFFIVALLAVPLALCETPELIAWGMLAFVLVLIADGFLVWFSFLKLFHSLGRDVPRFIEAVMAHYSGRMNQDF